MGVRPGAYATVWEVTPRTQGITSARISTSRKNKQTDSYEQDFGGYVSFVGSIIAQKALSLKPKDRIKIGDCEVTNSYDKEKKITYTNINIYSFEPASTIQQQPAELPPIPDVDDSVDDGGLPF